MNHPTVKFSKYQGHINSSELTMDPRIPDKNKILFIDSVDNFDYFTNKYGHMKNIIDSYYALRIKWDIVAQDFYGIGIDMKLFNDRFLMCRFNGKKYSSWWDDEYYYDGLNIFSASN